MTKLLFDHDPEVLTWCLTKWPSVASYHHAIGILDREMTLQGAFLLTRQNAVTAELTMVNEGAPLAPVAKTFFGAVFAVYHRLEMRTEKSNKVIKKHAPRLGFKFEGVDHDYYGPGEDALRFYMTPALCRFLRTDHERQEAA